MNWTASTEQATADPTCATSSSLVMDASSSLAFTCVRRALARDGEAIARGM